MKKSNKIARDLHGSIPPDVSLLLEVTFIGTLNVEKYILLAEVLARSESLDMLKAIVEIYRQRGLLKKHLGKLPLDHCSNTAKVKILIAIYTLALGFELYEKVNEHLDAEITSNDFTVKKGDLPRLNINISDGDFDCNIVEISRFVERKLIFLAGKLAVTRPPNERDTLLKNYIASLNDVWHNTQNNFYKDQIDYLQTVMSTTNSPAAFPEVDKYSHIFSNGGYRLFNYILENYVRVGEGRKADIAHYYWMMYEDKMKYIHKRPEEFKAWFCDEFGEEYLGQFRTLPNLKDIDRERRYQVSVEWLKSTRR